MTTTDVLKECPKDKGYQRTDEICWFIGRGSAPFDDEQRILAQRMTSVYQGVPDVWVAVPVFVLSNPSLQGTRLVPRTLEGVVQIPNKEAKE